MPTNFANSNITHVFVLMLENRSFDHMLGFSKLSGTDPETYKPTSIIGASSANKNNYLGVDYNACVPADYMMPYDPAHEFPDVVEQLCGQHVKYKSGQFPPINNSGFVFNYATTKSPGEGGATSNFGEIMKCYESLRQLPILTTLASEFAVCDNWFSSLPGPTWPNRFFVHAASSAGLDHSPKLGELINWDIIKGFNFPNGTIYDRLDKNNKGWRLYHGINKTIGSFPCVAALKGIHLRDTHDYENFESDINGDYPYSYTFIEPNYGDIINNSYSGGQSEHPMDDVRSGETLIKSTYEALRKSPLWLNSMLIITYDEHGGFYDHFMPPSATPPGDTKPLTGYNKYGFTFEQYGVRVPAVVVSAYTPQNIISHLTYDHSSVPATLETLFNMPALTARDANAKDVTSLANLKDSRTTLEKLPEVAMVSENELNLLKEGQPKMDETTSADVGNLPGFLYIAMKAHAEKETDEGKKGLMMTEFANTIKTRADARTYLETNLPDLLR